MSLPSLRNIHPEKFCKKNKNVLKHDPKGHSTTPMPVQVFFCAFLINFSKKLLSRIPLVIKISSNKK